MHCSICSQLNNTHHVGICLKQSMVSRGGIWAGVCVIIRVHKHAHLIHFHVHYIVMCIHNNIYIEEDFLVKIVNSNVIPTLHGL